jgi:hypothetical protein
LIEVSKHAAAAAFERYAKNINVPLHFARRRALAPQANQIDQHSLSHHGFQGAARPRVVGIKREHDRRDALPP